MEKGKRDFEVKRTAKAKDYLSIFSAFEPAIEKETLKKAFDEIPIMELREVCVDALSGDDLEIGWLIERAEAYFGTKYKIRDDEVCIPDYETVFILLKALAFHRGESQPIILQLMVDVVRSCMGESLYEPDFEKAIKILYNKIDNQPELYNEEVKRLLVDILEEYDNVTEPYPMDEYKSPHTRLLLKYIFLIAGCVKDISFIPLLKKNIFRKDDFGCLMKDNAIRKDYLPLESLRMTIIYHLENH